jgi:hypothetical protein
MSHKKLKLDTKYLRSYQIDDTGKTHVYNILSKSSYLFLGKVKWKPQWRGYWFVPTVDTGFNDACLDEISQFIKDLNEEKRVHLIATKKERE